MTRLADAQFVLLTTFRKDGTAVPTPVWAVPLDGALLDGAQLDGAQLDGVLGVWTPAGSGKVRRIRRSGAVTLAECDRRGVPLGDAVPGTAALLDDAGTRCVRDAVRRKYGLLGRVLTTLTALRRHRGGAIGVGITLDP